jgi:hypothetical protein
MKRTVKALRVPGVIAIVAVAAWFVLPGPFSHGVIVGFLGGLGHTQATVRIARGNADLVGVDASLTQLVDTQSSTLNRIGGVT